MSLFDSLKRFFGTEPSGPASEGGSGHDHGPHGQDCADHAHHAHGDRGITCQEALQLVHDFIDGELENVSRVEVEQHFEVCRQCYPHLRLERSFRAAVRRACARDKAPSELRERVLHIVSGE